MFQSLDIAMKEPNCPTLPNLVIITHQRSISIPNKFVGIMPKLGTKQRPADTVRNMYACMYVCMHARMHACMYVRTYVHTYVRTYDIYKLPIFPTGQCYI